MTPTQPPGLRADERELFEAEYARQFPVSASMAGKFDRDPADQDDYAEAIVCVAWRMWWQARAALTHPAVAMPDEVAYRFTDVQSGDTEASTDPDHKQGMREIWGRQPLYTRPVCAVPEGYALVPNWKGYALLGTGRYLLDHSDAPADDELGAELVISLATEADKAGGRQIGERREVGPRTIQPENMAIRIGFANERGLYALEDQLWLLRQEHFPGTLPAPQQDAASKPPASEPAVQQSAHIQSVTCPDHRCQFMGECYAPADCKSGAPATQPAEPSPSELVAVPLQVLEDARAAIGNFCMDHGWGDEDMQAGDNLDAYIDQHKARLAALAQHGAGKAGK